MGIDFTLLLPEFLLAGLAFLVLGLDLALPARWESRRNGLTGGAAALGMFGVMLFAVFDLRDTQETLYGGIYFVDRFALLFKVVFMGAGIAVTLMSIDYVGRKMRHPGEYYAMIVFSTLGAVMMAASGELLTAYVALELLAFSLYVLVGLTRGDARTVEASAKYILLGALSSAVLLFGIALLYGTLGSTVFREIAGPLSQNDTATTALGFTMVAAGLGFKLAVVPFHMWTPDVYEGAPTPVTAHLSVLSKAATFALLLRFLAEAAGPSFASWQLALAVLAALTMGVGTLVALAQTNIKRLFAYSSIAQVGFVLVGVAALGDSGGIVSNHAAAAAVVLHLVGYAFTNLTAFMAIIIVETHAEREEVAGYAGLASRSPLTAMALTAALLSLAGLPIFAGFVTKFYLFTAAAEAGLLWLVVIATAASLVSLYYYLQVVKQMYVGQAQGGALRLPRLSRATLLALFAGMVFVGVYPGPILDAVDAGVRVLAPFVSG